MEFLNNKFNDKEKVKNGINAHVFMPFFIDFL